MTLGEACNREVIITTRDAAALEAVRSMALVDWPVRLADMIVADVMNDELVSAPEHMSLHEALKKMQAYGIRRLPVVNASGGLEGIVTRQEECHDGRGDLQ